MSIHWPEPYLPPINLWNAPRQKTEAFSERFYDQTCLENTMNTPNAVSVYEVSLSQKEYEHLLRIAPDGIQHAMQSSLVVHTYTPSFNVTPFQR